MSKLRRLSRRAVIAICLLVVIAEIGLRFLGLGNPVLTCADPACSYLFSPNQHTTRFFCTNHLNQYSMRSDDITPEKPAGTFRTLMIGDSVLYGTTFVDQSRIFSSQIQRDLPAKLHEPVQVLNASCGGWAPGNELAYLTSRGSFESDLVVFVINSGDFEGTMNICADVTKEYITQRPSSALSELWSHYLSPRIFPAPPPHVDAGSVAYGTGEAVYGVIDDVFAIIRSAKHYSNDHHAGFAIVFSPALGGNWEGKGYQYGHDRLQTFVKENDIPLLDMTEAYRKVPLDQLYFTGNIHLRPVGHDLVAQAFLDAAPAIITSAAKQLEPAGPATVPATAR